MVYYSMKSLGIRKRLAIKKNKRAQTRRYCNKRITNNINKSIRCRVHSNLNREIEVLFDVDVALHKTGLEASRRKSQT